MTINSSFRLVLILVLATSCLTSLGQTVRKAAAFKTILDYQNGIVSDSFNYELASVNSEFINQLYRIHPKNRSYGHPFLQNQVYIVYDGEDIFINLKKLKMSRGFKRLESPRAYHPFNGRPAKPTSSDGSEGMAFGLLGGLVAITADAANAEAQTRKEVPYVFSMESGKVFSLSPATLDRLLDEYPELFELYRMDPNRKELDTMNFYLSLLNDLIETETK